MQVSSPQRNAVVDVFDTNDITRHNRNQVLNQYTHLNARLRFLVLKKGS